MKLLSKLAVFPLLLISENAANRNLDSLVLRDEQILGQESGKRGQNLGQKLGKGRQKFGQHLGHRQFYNKETRFADIMSEMLFKILLSFAQIMSQIMSENLHRFAEIFIIRAASSGSKRFWGQNLEQKFGQYLGQNFGQNFGQNSGQIFGQNLGQIFG